MHSRSNFIISTNVSISELEYKLDKNSEDDVK